MLITSLCLPHLATVLGLVFSCLVVSTHQGTLTHRLELEHNVHSTSTHQQPYPLPLQQAVDNLLSVDAYLSSLSQRFTSSTAVPSTDHKALSSHKSFSDGDNGDEAASSSPPISAIFDTTPTSMNTADISRDSSNNNNERLTTEKTETLDKLIYELVQEEEKEAIRNHFETTALKAGALKSRLDMKIDETLLILQTLKNLRRHIDNSYNFANRLVNSQVANDQVKRYVVSQLDNSIQQVEQALDNSSRKHA